MIAPLGWWQWLLLMDGSAHAQSTKLQYTLEKKKKKKYYGAPCAQEQCMSCKEGRAVRVFMRAFLC